MLERSDLRFILFSVGFSILFGLIFALSDGDLALSVSILLGALVISTVPTWINWSTLRLSLIFIFVFLILDVPSARPYYDYTPITETIGSFMFDAIEKVSSINGIPFTIFEIISFFILGLSLWKYFLSRHESSRTRPGIFLLVSFLLPLAAVWGAISGAAQGNDLRVAITQTRFLALYPTWCLIGILSIKNSNDLIKIFKVISAAILIKCFHALYIYFFELGANLTEREFLVDHLTSDFIATALTFIVVYYLFNSRNLKIKLASVAACIPLSYVYFLNDRRSSLVGVVLSIVLLLPLLPLAYFKKYCKVVLGGTILLAGFVAATWSSGGPLGFIARTIQSLMPGGVESTVSYRALEDYNLLRAVTDNPLLGLGFGRTFPLYVRLPDVSLAYENFDLIPHNTVLYLWTFAGPVGIAFLACFSALSIFLTARLIDFKVSGKMFSTTLAAVISFTMIVRWLVYAYGDIGLLEIRIISLVCLTLGGCAKIYQDRRLNISTEV